MVDTFFDYNKIITLFCFVLFCSIKCILICVKTHKKLCKFSCNTTKYMISYSHIIVKKVVVLNIKKKEGKMAKETGEKEL